MTQSDMTIKTFKTIIKKVTGVRHIELQGEGEPLLVKNFFEMVQSVLEHQTGVELSFITNGSFFTDSNNEQILDAGIQKIMVSIESTDNKIFKEIRGGKLEKVINGIESLMEMRRRYKQPYPRIGFAVTALRKTVPAISGIAHLYKELELDGGITLQKLQTMPQYREHYSMAMYSQIMRSQDIRELENIIINDPEILKVLEQGLATGGFYSALYDGKGKNWEICPWLEKGLYITVDGMATSCCFIKNSHTFGFGKIQETDITSILNCRADLLNKFKQGSIPANCEGCSLAQQAILNSSDFNPGQ
jgi:MoaA/NifB/PqqE/SkfB family radical SAM enzyme